MNFVKLLAADLKKQIWSRTFLMCVLGVALLEVLDTLPNCLQSSYRDGDGLLRFGTTVINLLETGGLTMFQLMVLSVCTLSAACCYCIDTESGILHEILVRSSCRTYTAAAMISCALTAFLCMVLGDAVMTAFYSGLLPVHREEAEAYQYSWPLLKDGHYAGYIAVVILQRGLRGAFFALAAFMLSGFVKNKFVIVSVPVLIFYFLQRFGYGYLGAAFDRVNVQMVYYFFLLKTETLSVLYALGYTIAAGILFGIVFYKGMRRTY